MSHILEEKRLHLIIKAFKNNVKLRNRFIVNFGSFFANRNTPSCSEYHTAQIVQ